MKIELDVTRIYAWEDHPSPPEGSVFRESHTDQGITKQVRVHRDAEDDEPWTLGIEVPDSLAAEAAQLGRRHERMVADEVEKSLAHHAAHTHVVAVRVAGNERMEKFLAAFLGVES